MGRYSPESQVTVARFVRQRDGAETVVGLPGGGVFLALPHEAVEVLDWLSAGQTCGEVRKRFLDLYGEDLDLGAFLTDLESRGFVQAATAAPGEARPGTEPAPGSGSKSHHFTFIPARAARALFHPLSGGFAFALFVAAVVALVLEPRLMPGWRNLAFEEHVLRTALALLILDLLGAFLHEMGHLLAARAQGVGARLGIGHRLWVLVAETDITGVWALPPRSRYLPFLAGPLVDVLSASVLVLLLFAGERGLLSIGDTTVRILAALVFIYCLRLVWQCYFFVRTDFYYVIATAFRCKNLMGDTETYLANLMRCLLRRDGTRDQSHIPRREMRVIRGYALVWLAGRAVALWILITVALPLSLHYVRLVVAEIHRGLTVGTLDVAASVLLTAASLILFGTGLWLWIRQLLTTRSLRR